MSDHYIAYERESAEFVEKILRPTIREVERFMYGGKMQRRITFVVIPNQKRGTFYTAGVVNALAVPVIEIGDRPIQFDGFNNARECFRFTVAHEMTHYDQWRRGDLDNIGHKWKGKVDSRFMQIGLYKKFCGDSLEFEVWYNNLPWEVEANARAREFLAWVKKDGNAEEVKVKRGFRQKLLRLLRIADTGQAA